MMLQTSIPIFFLGALSFIVALAWAPGLIRFLYAHRCWKPEVRTKAVDGATASIFARLHAGKETSIPRMAGVLIWVTTAFLAAVFFMLAQVFDGPVFSALNFLSRSQTWIPLATLVSASLIGLADDILVVRGVGERSKGGGIRFRHRLLFVFIIALVGAWWFYTKLGWNTLHIPLVGDLVIGWLYIPLFVSVMIALFTSSIVDGVDGLAGGIFAILFATFAAIAFARTQFDVAAFCTVVAGSLLAFLWFNIPPAKFFMGETGILGLTTTLAVVAFITDSVVLLSIFCLVLWVEMGSVVLQLLSKKIRGKKLFLVAPLHHHLEAKGWPNYQITMRFWMITALTSLIGLTIALLDTTYQLPFVR
jgi:phospho-N-acetylmuramoyl-pentapeptide-transferase